MKPDDLGKKILVEECQKVNISEFILGTRRKLKEMIIFSELSVFNVPIGLSTSKTGFSGTRYWFACPSCRKRVGVLYVHPLNRQIGCRLCLGLEYRKRRYKGMVENDLPAPSKGHII